MKKPIIPNKIMATISGILFLALASFVLLFLIEHKKLLSCTKNYYAVVDDSLFDEYFSDIHPPEAFSLISLSDFYSLDLNCGNEAKKGPYACAVAFVTKNEGMAFFDGEKENAHTKNYSLRSKYYFPSAETDFNQVSSLNISKPNFTILLTDAENLPQGNKAIPVDSKYAGDQGYALEKETYARCTVVIPDFEKTVFDFFDEFFKDKNVCKDNITFLAAVGDIMVEGGAQKTLIEDENGLKKVFGTTLPVLQSNDIMIGNLEGAVTESRKRIYKSYTFKFHKEVLPALKKAGFNYFMQTNNHCYDYGEEGFKDTLAALKEYGIPTSGAGYTAEEAKKFYHTTVNGTNFAIISCGAFPIERTGFNGEKTATATDTRAGILWQNEELFENIKKEKASGNFVIVNVHGGFEYRHKPHQLQRDLYEKFVDCGADLVFGSHPHVIQPTEWYKGKLIVYSLGNFIFNGESEFAVYGALDSEIVRVGLVNGKIVYTEIYPTRHNETSVRLR